jgi:hypothetical protein
MTNAEPNTRTRRHKVDGCGRFGPAWAKQDDERPPSFSNRHPRACASGSVRRCRRPASVTESGRMSASTAGASPTQVPSPTRGGHCAHANARSEVAVAS